MAQIWLSMAIGQLMHQGTTAVFWRVDIETVLLKALYLPLGDRQVYGQRSYQLGEGVWYGRLGLWGCMDKSLVDLIIIYCRSRNQQV